MCQVPSSLPFHRANLTLRPHGSLALEGLCASILGDSSPQTLADTHQVDTEVCEPSFVGAEGKECVCVRERERERARACIGEWIGSECRGSSRKLQKSPESPQTPVGGEVGGLEFRPGAP